jgi:hypothetical protein
MTYWYKGKRHTHKPVKTKVKAAIKHLASRAWESIQGDHPAGGEALVERMIREYPGIEPTQPDNSSEKD